MSGDVMDGLIDRAARVLHRARFVCAMTGAGVSAESGLSTFRGPDGLWKNRDPSDVATPEALRADPRGFWEFYHWRIRQAARVRPNPGHFALAALQRLCRGFGLATQNVDRLHQRAGSTGVVELHGNIEEVRCTACDYHENVGLRELPPEPRCPCCHAWLRPCVVLFNELLPADALRAVGRWSRDCDVFVSIGTSGLVWPAAQFAYDAIKHGARLIEINLEPTPLTPHSHLCLSGRSGDILPRIVAAVERLAAGQAPPA